MLETQKFTHSLIINSKPDPNMDKIEAPPKQKRRRIPKSKTMGVKVASTRYLNTLPKRKFAV